VAVTEPLRHVAAMALLVGNGVFLFLGISDLLFVVTGWSSGFGARSEAVFDYFAGPVAVALPLLAMLIATHVSPALPRSRTILLVALGEYALSALFGVITYLGAFAHGLFEVRSTFDGLLGRAVWLAFLTIALTAVYRVYRVMFPPPPPTMPYRYPPTVYGQPYPGQPTYPRPTQYRSASAGVAPAEPTAPTAEVPPAAPPASPQVPPPPAPPQVPASPASQAQADPTRLMPRAPGSVPDR
jgi:hypothetical protein